ncbi:hypothetical protein M3Y95_00717100 [Aphelenchoides besseyi]|nr:hypothetical protein M3Y95_00717100 [Aphelenchoides besseyi]
MNRDGQSIEKQVNVCLRRFQRTTSTKRSQQQLFHDLATILVSEFKIEIETAVQRILFQSRLTNLSTSSSGIGTHRTYDLSSQFAQRRFRSAVNGVAFCVHFKFFRDRLLHVCRHLTPTRSLSSPDARIFYSSSADSTGTLLALSTLSFGQSLRPAAAFELNQFARLISDSTVLLSQRLTALDRLLGTSSLSFARTEAAKTFVSGLPSILIVTQLFDNAMQLIVRVWSASDNNFHREIASSLASSILPVMSSKSVNLTYKLRFADVLLQILNHRPPVNEMLTTILTTDLRLLRLFAALDTNSSWFRLQIHSFNQRKQNQEAIFHFIRCILNGDFLGSIVERCFGFSSLLHFICYHDLVDKMLQKDREQLTTFLSNELPIMLTEKQLKIRRLCTSLLLESLAHQTTSRFFVINVELYVSFLKTRRRIVVLRGMAKIVRNISLAFHLLADICHLMNFGIKAKSRIGFAATVETLRCIIRQSEFTSFVLENVNIQELTARLNTKIIAHSKLLKLIEDVKQKRS